MLKKPSSTRPTTSALSAANEITFNRAETGRALKMVQRMKPGSGAALTAALWLLRGLTDWLRELFFRVAHEALPAPGLHLVRWNLLLVVFVALRGRGNVDRHRARRAPILAEEKQADAAT